MYLIINNQFQKWLSLVFKWKILNVCDPNIHLFIVFWLCCLCCLLLINGLVVFNCRANCGSSQPAWSGRVVTAQSSLRTQRWSSVSCNQQQSVVTQPITNNKREMEGERASGKTKREWRNGGRSNTIAGLHKDTCVKLQWKAYLAKDVVAEIIWVPSAKCQA